MYYNWGSLNRKHKHGEKCYINSFAYSKTELDI